MFDKTPVDTRTIARVLIYHKIPGAQKKNGVETARVQNTGRKQRHVRRKLNYERNMWIETQSVIRCKYSSTGAIQESKLINGAPRA